MTKIPAQNYPIIQQWISHQSRVLDLGCGDGTLLSNLIREKNIEGIGVEISQEMIIQCIQKGISVYQADIDKDLSEWSDSSFDYVILNATLQAITRPYRVIEEMLRVGKHAIISVSNFGYISNRIRVLAQGRVSSQTRSSQNWYDSPVIRFVSLKEFEVSLKEMGIIVEDSRFFLAFNSVIQKKWPFHNLLAREGIFKLTRGAQG
jgi:methionine biosynthesis protein MetW